MGKRSDAARAALAQAMTMLNAASDACPPLKGASGGLLTILQLDEKLSNNRQDYADLLRRLAGIARDLANFHGVLAEQDISARVEVFKGCLENLASALTPLSRRSRIMSPLFAAEDEKTIQGCHDRLDKLILDFQIWTDLAQLRELSSLRTAKLLSGEDIPALAAAVAATLPRPEDTAKKKKVPDASIAVSVSTPGFNFTMSPSDGVRLHIAPVTCVLFA